MKPCIFAFVVLKTTERTMKQFFKMFFASLLAMIVMGIIAVGLLIGSITALVARASKETKVKQGSVLVVDLQKHIHEVGEENPFAIFNSDASSPAGMYDVVHAIAKAKTDNNIKGIIIKLHSGNNGWATLQQLRIALKDFKTSNKFVYAYGEDIPQSAYYVASVADSIYLNPVGDIALKGFATVLPFFKNTLDRLDLQPEIFYAGKFKSATEPFRADKMSEPNKLQTSRLQHNFWNEYMKAVMEHTHVDSSAINQWAATGAIQFPSDALKYKLVDGLRYWDEVEQSIRTKTNQKDTENIKYISLGEYASTVKTAIVSGNRIAVLYAEGDIVDGEQNDDYEIASKTFIQNIRKLRDNKDIKAVVLRVNSPGGSALASEVILRELQLLRKKKPLVVSMGDVAASGGYYISSQADSIFALPTTITGSIGVFSMMFNVGKLMNSKLGVTFDGVKTAPYADFPTGTRALTPEEGRRMQNSVDTIYSIFKSRVSAGRRIASADVDSIAQGRVWTGYDALNIHLVDAIGDLNRAIKSAASLAKVSDYKIVTYPQPGDRWETIIRKLRGNNIGDAAIKQTIKEQLGTEYGWYKKLQSLGDMNGKAMMAMPFDVSIQ